MQSKFWSLLVLFSVVVLPVVVAGSLPSLQVVQAAGPTPEATPQPHGNPLDVMPVIAAVDLPEGGTLQVVATTATVAQVVDKVGGDAIQLTGLIQPGQDSHAYQPTPRDVAAMTQADLLFINGAGLEEFMHDIMDNLQGKVTIVPVSAGINLIPGHHHERDDDELDDDELDDDEHDADEHDADELEHGHAFDPHTWTSPANVMIWVDNIEAALSSADPAHAAAFKANADTFRSELKQADDWAQEAVAQIPQAKRKIVTNHESWNYFAGHYGFEQVGTVVPAVTSSVEPSAQDFAALTRTLKDQGVSVLFIDYEVNPALSETIANEVGAKVVRIWHDISPQGEGADTYVDWLHYNVNQFVDHLK